MPDIAFADWVRLLNDLAWTKPFLTLFGGEPLLFPFIDDLLAEIARLECSGAISTNGYFLVDHLSSIINAKLQIVVSIDGINDIHNVIRGNSTSFQHIIAALERIKKYKDSGEPVKWFANAVLLPENVECLRDLIAILMQYSPSGICLQHPQWESKHGHALMNAEWQRLFGIKYDANFFMPIEPDFNLDYFLRLQGLMAWIREDKEVKDIVHIFPDFSSDEVYVYYEDNRHITLRTERKCRKPWLVPTINSNGDVLLCVDKPVGNIKDESFWDIWYSPQALSLRETLAREHRLPFCTRCCYLYQYM